MASLLLPESYACINGDDGLEGFKASEIHGALLMSFLEELQDEERDDERLNSVIQSLEAEINSSRTTVDESQVMSDGEDSDRSCSFGHLYDRDCSIAELEIGVADMEAVPNCSPPSDDMNWYMESYGDEMHSIINGGFAEVNDYSHNVYYGVAQDLEAQGGYSSLWQETTYDSMMYDSLPQCTF